MKLRIALAVLAFGWLAAPSRVLAAGESRPNIVLIIADDLGAEDVGAFGNQGVHTPNLDALARDGMKFTRAFNTCSSCSPSRCSIITGRYPHNTGAEMLHMPLPKEQITFVEKLKAAGYWTAQSGKWHMGNFVKDRFDVVNSDVKPIPVGDDDGSGCVKWISTLQQRPKDKPFFLWLASIDPHRPYFEGTLAVPHTPEESEVPPFLPDTLPTRKDLAQYYDEISRLDRYVGKVIAELKAQGVLDNTVIFFVTDNGRPFPRCKVSVYDSGIQSPLLVRWPGHIKPGGVSASLASSVDLAPTILELAGLPASPTFQGKSFARLLTEPAATIRDRVFAEHNWHDYAGCERSVRTTKFKYIRNFWPDLPNTPAENDNPTIDEMRRLRDADKLTPAQMNCFIAPRPAEELYDVVADPQELNNLAADPRHAAALTELRGMLDEWRSETADFVWSPRPADGFNRATGKPLPGVSIGKPPRLTGEKQFAPDAKAAAAPSMQAVSNAVSGQIEIFDAGRPVLRYNYRTIEPGAVLANIKTSNLKYARPRSDYIHPLYGLNGEELTRDWAVDHPHHRGIYWAWPEVEYGTNRADLHALQNIFARPTGKVKLRSGADFAQIDAENQWLWEDREPIVRELATIRAYPATEQGRAIDLKLRFVALKDGVTVARRKLNHYGGLNVRLLTPPAQVISIFTNPPDARLLRAWADVSGFFAGSNALSGLMVIQHPQNLEYPGEWVQFPNLSWCQPAFPTGGTRYALRRGEPLVLLYRLWIHNGGKPDESVAAGLWDEFAAQPLATGR